MSTELNPDPKKTAATTEPADGKTIDRPAGGIAAWVKNHRGMSIGAIGVIGVVLVGGILAVRTTFKKQTPHKQLATLQQALQALDNRSFAKAEVLAKQLREQGATSSEEMGGPEFVLGAATAYEAQNATDKERPKLYLLAAEYLKDANNRGFPPDRKEEGLYLLGKSLYESGQYRACRSVLLSALNTAQKNQAEIHAILAEAYLHDVPPDFEHALQQNAILLADEKLTETKRSDVLLQRAQILLEMENIDGCKAVLDKISAEVKKNEAAILYGRAILAEARAMRKKNSFSEEDRQQWRNKVHDAIKAFSTFQDQDADGKMAGQASYLIGVCHEEIGDEQAALGQFNRTRNSFPDTAEAAAAGFQTAELYRRMNRDVDALAEYRRMLGGIQAAGTYNNPWLPSDQLNSDLLAAYRHYMGAEKFEFALQIIRAARKVLAADQVLLLQAEAHAAWGQNLLNQAGKGPLDKAESNRRMGREQFRRAGVCYAQLADLQPANKNYSEQLWNSATSFFKGQDFKKAAREFQTYLKNEIQNRQPQALTYLGESLLAAGRFDEALDALRECMDLNPRDAAACRARLLAARAYEEKADYKGAEKMLAENLNGDYLAPESKEWRDSLLTLGEILYAQGRYTEAAGRLEEYVNRYPDLPDATRAGYLLADSYYMLASDFLEKLGASHLNDSYSVQAEKIRKLYDKALMQYRRVDQILANNGGKAELSPAENAILRNCRFAVGNILSAQGDYAAAVEAYSAAVSRYQTFPGVLEAYVQLVEAYRKLNMPDEAERVLRQAKFAIGKIKSDSALDETTNYTRKQWTEMLKNLGSM
jgi:tetratricopeptide (TPR) repeat protein